MNVCELFCVRDTELAGQKARLCNVCVCECACVRATYGIERAELLLNLEHDHHW